MNRFITVLLASASSFALSYGAEINYVNTGSGPNPDILSDRLFIGSSGTAAAEIANLIGLTVSNSTFFGGAQGEDAAGQGLKITDVDSSLFQGPNVLSGGSGGSVAINDLNNGEGLVVGGAAVLFSGGATDLLDIQDGIFSGGTGGDVSGQVKLFEIQGGDAVRVSTSADIDISGGNLIGGDAGSSSADSRVDANAKGGNALSIGSGTSATYDLDISGGTFTGGTGGAIINTTVQSDPVSYNSADGGNALDIRSQAKSTTTIDGGVFSGGTGGTASFHSSVMYPDEIIFDQTVFKQYLEDFTYGASGGHGIRIRSGNFRGLTDGTLIIDGGSFTGGDGGVSANNGMGSSFADGGDGVFTDFANVTINGGTFQGGAAGASNLGSEDGAGVRFRNGKLSITDGTFFGLGLYFEAMVFDSTATISGGVFEDVLFYGRTFDFAGRPYANIYADITGGTFDTVGFSGGSLNDASFKSNAVVGAIFLDGNGKNDIKVSDGASVGELVLTGEGINEVNVFGGASVDSILFGGSGVNATRVTQAGVTTLVFDGFGENSLFITNNGVAIDTAEQYSGVANVDFNTTHAINNMYISNGEMNISGSDLDVTNGNVYQLVSKDSRLNVEGMTVNSGATLDVGLGQVTASSFEADSGAQLLTKYDVINGVTNIGSITSGDLTFNTELSWEINTGTNAIVLGHEFVLAHSTSSALTSSLVASNMVYVGANWLGGITNVNVVNTEYLSVAYGINRIDNSLETDPNTDFGQAMLDLSDLLDTTGPQYDIVGAMTEAEAEYNLENAYVRTPEMASALIGLQAVFSDQIKDRTRSYLRLDHFGGVADHAPAGPAGPEDWYDNSKEWMSDHLPKKDVRGGVRSVSDQAPVVPERSNSGKAYAQGREYDAIMTQVNELAPHASGEKIAVPTTYQVWGRGYGSYLDQKGTEGHAGYNATIAGGILGVDKRFNNMLLGLGGGYTRTMLTGNSGNDGTANTGHGVGYFSVNTDKLYIDANLNYAFNAVETEGLSDFGYTGEYDAHTVGFYLGGGYGISAFKDAVLFTPEASLLTTYYNRDGYTETSSLGFSDKTYDSYDQWSYLSALGATISMLKQFDSFNMELEFQPELRAHWLHEFNADVENETYAMVPGNQIGVSLQAREEDLFKLGAGVRFSKWDSDTTEFGLDLDGTFGKDYSAIIVSGKIMHRF